MSGERSGGERWYRVPFVWLLIAIPATAVVFGVSMLSVSVISFDGLVADDYYQRGKAINRMLARDRVARGENIRAQAQFEDGGRRLVVALESDAPDAPDAPGGPLELELIHPTRAGHDQTVSLRRRADGLFEGTLAAPAPGRWIVQLGTSRWRLLAPVRLPEQRAFALLPQSHGR